MKETTTLNVYDSTILYELWFEKCFAEVLLRDLQKRYGSLCKVPATVLQFHRKLHVQYVENILVQKKVWKFSNFRSAYFELLQAERMTDRHNKAHLRNVGTFHG
jgi:hypothetical protein